RDVAFQRVLERPELAQKVRKAVAETRALRETQMEETMARTENEFEKLNGVQMRKMKDGEDSQRYAKLKERFEGAQRKRLEALAAKFLQQEKEATQVKLRSADLLPEAPAVPERQSF
ncbi:unnamed protein product, partial [Amoebophrya sp. A25]